MAPKIISADSHITEAPDTYRKYIDAKCRDQAPHIAHDEKMGDVFVLHGQRRTPDVGQ